jgi:hypothetical protein
MITERDDAMPMTPGDLVQWRWQMNWPQVKAATELGLSFRAYRYLEEGTTSRGRPIALIPRDIEVACGVLSRLGPTSRADKDLQRALIRLEIAKREVAEAERAVQSIESAQKTKESA